MSNLTKVNNPKENNPKKDTARKRCLKCEKEKPTHRDFYLSNSQNHADKRYPICKQCMIDGLNQEDKMSRETIESIQAILLEMNRPFIYHVYLSTVEETDKTGKQLFGMYVKNIGMRQYKDLTWKESEFEYSDNNSKKSKSSKVETNDIQNTNESPKLVIVDNKNSEDVLRMLGYDPFEYESKEDKFHLYNKLIDFLDESTIEDGFKLQAVIEIVKGFNQIDKINQAITNITNDVNKLSNNSGGIKSLIDSKKNILASLISLAKDNGISVNHNNNKSKGGGTLSGIIKNLQEKGFEEADLNLFNIETSDGMRQVADISNKSIVAQLQFDENDYTSMLSEQREIIERLEITVSKFEEENRLLKKELIKYGKSES